MKLKKLVNLLIVWAGAHPYLVTFVILFLCGLGLPIPEEATLIAAGYVAYSKGYDPFLLSVTALAAILAGDLCMFLLGRRYGETITQHRWLSKICHAKNMEKARAYFDKYGNKTIFVCRFLAGVRIPAFFSAGALGMKMHMFLLADLLGALISVPTSIYLVYHFGSELDQAFTSLERFKWIFLAVLIAVVGGYIGWVLARRKYTRQDPAV